MAVPGHLVPGSILLAAGAAPNLNHEKGVLRVSRVHARASGGRCALRPSDASLESQDAPVSLHGARRHLHHRPAADASSSSTRPHAFVRNVAERGGSVLFVGTKKQCQDAIAEQAARVGMRFVNHRWLGGLLTNWRTISNRLERLDELRRLRDDGQLELLPPKERISMLGRAREARDEPGRRPRDEAISRTSSSRRRPEEGAACHPRGTAPQHPCRRARGHELRPRRRRAT